MGTTSSKPVHSKYPFETPGQGRTLASRLKNGKQTPLKPILKSKDGIRMRPDSALGYVPGFVPMRVPVSMPVPEYVPDRVFTVGPTAPTHQPLVEPPVPPPIQAPRRANTPFQRPQHLTDSDGDSDAVIPQMQWPSTQHAPQQAQRHPQMPGQQQHTPYQAYGILNRNSGNHGVHIPQATPTHMPRHIVPEPQPRQRHRAQPTIIPELNRPPKQLPAPPKNVYEESPFNTLLNLPQVPSNPPITTATLNQRSVPRKKSRSRGLFGFGRRKSPEVKYVPIYLAQSPPVASSSSVHPNPGTPIRFNNSLQPVSFMNHSPHRIMYQNITYPSATHLHEAFKFLEHRPDLAAAIERCTMEEVYAVSTSFNEFVRPDWGSVFLQFMDEVLYLKFKQHQTIRTILMSSGDLNIIYAEPGDAFWGEGTAGQGANELGKAIMRVRTRLRAEEGLV